MPGTVISRISMARLGRAWTPFVVLIAVTAIMQVYSYSGLAASETFIGRLPLAVKLILAAATMAGLYMIASRIVFLARFSLASIVLINGRLHLLGVRTPIPMSNIENINFRGGRSSAKSDLKIVLSNGKVVDFITNVSAEYPGEIRDRIQGLVDSRGA